MAPCSALVAGMVVPVALVLAWLAAPARGLAAARPLGMEGADVSGSDHRAAAQLDEIHEALVRDGYYVDPSREDSFTPGQLGEITAALRAAEQPTYVVAYPFADNDAFGGNGADLLARLHAEHPDPGST